jgi:hypothetical protein
MFTADVVAEQVTATASAIEVVGNRNKSGILLRLLNGDSSNSYQYHQKDVYKPLAFLTECELKVVQYFHL